MGYLGGGLYLQGRQDVFLAREGCFLCVCLSVCACVHGACRTHVRFVAEFRDKRVDAHGCTHSYTRIKGLRVSSSSVHRLTSGFGDSAPLSATGMTSASSSFGRAVGPKASVESCTCTPVGGGRRCNRTYSGQAQSTPFYHRAKGATSVLW